MDAGAGLVKFQLYDSMKLYGEPGHNELSFEQAKELFDFGKANGIEVFFSVFDTERVKWCEKIGVKRFKIAARWNQDKELRSSVLATRRPFYISVEPGQTIKPYAMQHILRCVSKYPAELKELHLSRFYGFSDHTIGLDAAKIAIALGMNPIEKHFCIDHQTGVDAPWSMDKDELKELVDWEAKVKLSL